MGRSPIERMIDAAPMKCTICDRAAGTCDCWTQCSCGWSTLTGFQCRNPETTRCSTKLRNARPFTHEDVRAAWLAHHPDEVPASG